MRKLSFYILPLGTYNVDIVNDVYKLLVNVFGAEVKILNLLLIPEDLKDLYRRQYNGLRVLNWLNTLIPSREGVLVGIADGDAYVSGLNFIFGIADPTTGIAVVFLERLKADVTIDKFLIRVRKEVLHEVGHVLGLKHCPNKRCVMTFSNSIYDTDYKECKYCRQCHSILLKLGYRINTDYVIT